MEELYDEAKESIKRYQESGEGLTDFDAFMDAAEKEIIFKSYTRLLLRDLNDMKAALVGKDYARAEWLLDELIDDTQKNIED